MTPLTSLLLATCLATSAQSQEPGVAWRIDLGRLRPAAIVEIHACGDLLLVEDSAHGVSALDAASGQPRWFVQASGPLLGSPVRHDDTIALGSSDRLLVVDADVGSRKADLSLDAVPPVPSVVIDDLAYVAEAHRGRLRVIHLRTGLERWHIDLPGGLVAAPLGAGQGRHAGLVLACGDGKLRALASGDTPPREELWMAYVGDLAAAPALVQGTLVTLGRDGQLVARDAVGGRVRWSRLIVLDAVSDAALHVQAGAVLVQGSRGVSAYALNDGQVLLEQNKPGLQARGLGGAGALLGSAGQATLYFPWNQASPSALTLAPSVRMADGVAYDFSGGILRRLEL